MPAVFTTVLPTFVHPEGVTKVGSLPSVVTQATARSSFSHPTKEVSHADRILVILVSVVVVPQVSRNAIPVVFVRRANVCAAPGAEDEKGCVNVRATAEVVSCAK